MFLFIYERHREVRAAFIIMYCCMCYDFYVFVCNTFLKDNVFLTCQDFKKFERHLILCIVGFACWLGGSQSNDYKVCDIRYLKKEMFLTYQRSETQLNFNIIRFDHKTYFYLRYFVICLSCPIPETGLRQFVFIHIF